MTPEAPGRTNAGFAVCEPTRAAVSALRFGERLAREIARFRDVDCPKDYPETRAPLAGHRLDAGSLVDATDALGPDRAREFYAAYHRACAVPVFEDISDGRWRETYELHHGYLTRLEQQLLEGEETRGV